jgi:hypothetical protein
MNTTNSKTECFNPFSFVRRLGLGAPLLSLGVLLVSFSTFAGTNGVAVAASGWTDLLDAKLTHWELWMGVPHVSVQGLPAGTPTSPDGHGGTPLGLHNDPKQVFTMIEEDGQPVLKITGEIFGGLTSLQAYSNYCFHAQFKWGKTKWEPKLQVVRDNGILFHCTGSHGAFWNVWKRSVEFQVEEHNMGDAYFLAGTGATAAVKKGNDGKYNYDAAGERLPFGQIPDSKHYMVKHLPGDFEKPNGDWNTLELYTMGGTAAFVVNGQVVQVLHGTALGVDKSGQKQLLCAGQIQIQSEGAEAYYRDIKIKPIIDFPGKIREAAGL